MEIKLPDYLKYTIIILGIILLIWLMQMFKSVLVPFAFAMLFAMLLLPLVHDLEKKVKIPRPLAILLSLVLVVAVLGMVVWFISVQVLSLTSELDTIGNNVGDLVDKVQLFLFNKFGIVPSNRSDLVRNAIGSLQDIATSFLGNTISMTTGAIAAFTIVPIFVFCLLYYRDHLQQFMFQFVAKDRRSSVIQTVTNIQQVVQSYISGLMIVIVIVSLLNSAGLLFLGVKYAIFFGIFASILTIIPYIGILIGALLPALFTLAATGHLIDAVLVVFVFMFVQFLEGNFITPLIVGSKVSINPFAAIVALLVGGEIWGAAGMILSIPLIAILKVMFDAYEPLKPFGFLLADIDDVAPKKHAKVTNWFMEIWNGLGRGKRKDDEDQNKAA
ncbi:AI-2E family transporter [Pontibacter sp. BT310]|uniref:AI-2E family transporter n=1 Tax=Pontibacter populi TaxID=890055 RepID=A0ABS6X9Z5_9BACT|nr:MULTISPECIES: AI-2E family transporter [Pontibacter]MBJ6117955.1 AI-2E family transporter [Pontibacter sp. BT310]MBR0570382.1 AI-2E family transporter [Microvirga sp. STS03]MBW3364808.1 AI-2E family transporter [Pontibacter populi]